MYWSGSKARFWGVTWNGADTQETLSLELPATRNYHINVRHALKTAPKLADFLNNTVGGEITLAAHSLGNMAVSSSLTDHSAKVKNYFMIDTAIAMEAFDGSIVDELATTSYDRKYKDMDHPYWEGYDYQLLAAEWYRLFKDAQPIDNRATLTWRDRFKNLPNMTNVLNFYSSGEEVLRQHPYDDIAGIEDIGLGVLRDAGVYAWALQEKLKGRMITYSPIDVLGSAYSGWGFNLDDDDYWQWKIPLILKEPISSSVANGIERTQLRTRPFFDIGPDDANLFIEMSGSGHAKNNRDRLLAEAFPARTFAVGANSVKNVFGDEAAHNFDMQTYQENGWPRIDGNATPWLHSDIRDVAYIYTYKLFDDFTVKGGLK